VPDLRVGAVGGADTDGGPREDVSLADTEYYITRWEVSGPYSDEGKGPEALLDVALPPEEGGEVEWQPLPEPQAQDLTCPWKLLDNKVMEVRGGGIISKRTFLDHRLHIEFRTPFMPDAREQSRGNSGVYVQGRYEVQILDSYGLEGLDNECGGIYRIARPRVNMCAPPLQWQTYDITFHAPQFDEAGNKTKDAVITAYHNGVAIHENLVLPEATGGPANYDIAEPCGLYLQDHGNPVQFRNVWAVDLAKPEGM
jgi:hypothetical protein